MIYLKERRCERSEVGGPPSGERGCTAAKRAQAADQAANYITNGRRSGGTTPIIHNGYIKSVDDVESSQVLHKFIQI